MSDEYALTTDEEIALEARVKAALEAPDHQLVDGFCPKCNGSCLVDFGNPARLRPTPPAQPETGE